MRLRKLLATTTIGAALLGAVVACDDGPSSRLSATAVVDRSQSVTQEECAQLDGAISGSGAPSLSMVVDQTGSNASTGLPDSTLDRFVAVARAGGTVTIVGVNGAGAPPLMIWTRRPVAPASVLGTPREAPVIELAAACALRASRNAVPTAPGSDVLGAVGAAVDALGPDRAGSAVEVISDGYSSAGALRFDTGVDPGESPPDDVARAVADAQQLPDLTGVDVAVHLSPFAGRPAEEAPRRWIGRVIEVLLGLGGAAHPRVDRETGPPLPADAHPRPADPVLLPAPQPPIVAAAGDVRRLSGNAFFEPGSATLLPGVDRDLAGLAEALAPGAGVRAEIVGHVASWGSVAYQDDLAARRAETIRAALVRLGADGTALTARGVGAREPLVDDLDAAGRLLPDKAAQNRRVDVLLSPRAA